MCAGGFYNPGNAKLMLKTILLNPTHQLFSAVILVYIKSVLVPKQGNYFNKFNNNCVALWNALYVLDICLGYLLA